jgi:hypothetical protein
MKRAIFGDVTPYSPIEDNRHFGGTHCFYLQDRRVSQASKKQEELSAAAHLLLDFCFT